MLQPKRTRFRKQFKGRIHGVSKGGTDLNFGAYGLKAVEPERITARQIEAARRAITRYMKRSGRVWIRIFRIFQLHLNRPKFVWVKVREVSIIGQLVWHRDVSCLSLMGFPKTWHVKP